MLLDKMWIMSLCWYKEMNDSDKWSFFLLVECKPVHLKKKWKQKSHFGNNHSDIYPWFRQDTSMGAEVGGFGSYKD